MGTGRSGSHERWDRSATRFRQQPGARCGNAVTCRALPRGQFLHEGACAELNGRSCSRPSAAVRYYGEIFHSDQFPNPVIPRKTMLHRGMDGSFENRLNAGAAVGDLRFSRPPHGGKVASPTTSTGSTGLSPNVFQPSLKETFVNCRCGLLAFLSQPNRGRPGSSARSASRFSSSSLSNKAVGLSFLKQAPSRSSNCA